MKLILELPWPPSVNHYWFQNGNRRFIGKKGKEFRALILTKIEHLKQDLWEIIPLPLLDRLSVKIQAFVPDKRKRDLDNLNKATLDALQHAGLYEDDNQIDFISVERKEIIKGGKLIVEIEELS